VGDGGGDGVVLVAGDDKHRSTVGVLGVDLGFSPRVQVGVRRLEEWRRRGRAPRRSRIVPWASFLADDIGERVAELVEVNGTARWRLRGFPSTGLADLKAEIGRGSTPRNGAASIATDAAESPCPATTW